ncbi:MAG: hypothetical protein ACK4SL_02030 [Candidatus Paceibacteria bacterium]
MAHHLVGKLVWVAVRTGAEGADDEITPQLRLVEDVVGNQAKLEGGELVTIAKQLQDGTWTGECFADNNKKACFDWCDRIMRHLSLVRYVRRHNWLGPNFKSDDSHN